MLRLTPGALTAHRLDQRPAALPSQLFVHGGRAPTVADVVVFDGEHPRLHPLEDPEQLLRWRRRGVPIWLRVRGLGDEGRLATLLTQVGVPSVLLPALLDEPQRPQVDCLGDVVLVVLHRFGFALDGLALVSDQVGLMLLPGLLITVEEAPSGQSFPELTDWLLAGTTPVEDRDLDDILHFLVDDLLDDLFPILERIGYQLEELEERALQRPKPKVLNRTFQLRSNVRTIRRQIWPLRHQIRVLVRDHQPLLGPEAIGGFREMGEIVDLLYEGGELLRTQCDAITQVYAASIGNRMNQVMKTLTILTSIFAPLTFIAGIYGMNFQVMPELAWRYGYAYALLLMLLVGAIQSYWLWRRGWFQDWTAQK